MKKIRCKFALLLSAGLLFFGAHSYGQYCIPSSSDGCSEGDEINTFILNGENGTGFNNPNTGCSAGAYDNRTALPAVDLMPGLNYTATVSSSYYDPFFGDGDFCAVWIDLDNSGTFESTERVGGTNSFILDTGSPLTISIPGTAPQGNRRMRVVMAYSILVEDMDPCNSGIDTWDYGEVHDYTVNILPPPACAFPTALTAVTSGNTTTVSWSGTGNFIAEYGPVGFTPGTGTTAGINGTIIASAVSPQPITGLSGGVYDVYVRKNCGTSFSINIKKTFTTNDECNGAIDISSGSLLTTSSNGSSESAPSCGGGAALDAWYKVTTTSAGDLTLTAAPSGGADIVLEVFSGDCNTLSSLDCVDDFFGTETYTIAGATAGTTYYMRVYDYNNGQVNFSIQASGTPLPVSMNQLSGQLSSGNLAQLTWTTFTETSNRGFEIQRSQDGRNFSTSGWVNSKATNGNSRQELMYTYLDRNPVNGKAYYRLMQVDNDGKSAYSNVIGLSLSGKNDGKFAMTAAPNPTSNSVVVSTYGKQGVNGMIYVTDMTGKAVQTHAVTGTETIINMKGLAQGLYLIKYMDAEHTQTIKVSKQ